MHDVIQNERTESDGPPTPTPTSAPETTSPAAPARGATIVVNGRRMFVEDARLDFAAIVDLAFPYFGEKEHRSYTVMFRHGPANAPEGFVAPGETVTATDRESFVVTATDKS